MDRLTPALIVISILLLAFALMLLGWRNRRRRQAGLGRPQPLPEGIGEPSIRVPVLYVATTRADAPLDRIAVHGLGFRSRGEVGVHPEGVVLALRGQEPVYVPAAAVRGATRATWTIDRVVEEGGLVMLAWTLDGTEVDSYLRVTDDRAAALLAALRAVAPADGAALRSDATDPHPDEPALRPDERPAS